MERLRSPRLLCSVLVLCLAFHVCERASLKAQSQGTSKYDCALLSQGIQKCVVRAAAGSEPSFYRLLDTMLTAVGYFFPASTDRPFERSIALLVGVSKYANLSPQLGFVKNDLEDMRDFLLGFGGFDTVYIMADDNATPELVDDYMLNVFTKPQTLTERDRLLFYFAGHGDALNGRVGYLQFGQAKPGDFAHSVLRMDQVYVWSQAIHARHILFFIDACASGLAVAQRANRTPDPAASFAALLSTFSSKGSRTLITAGTADQATYEVQSPIARNHGNGVFTRSFLDAALSQETDRLRKGFLTIDEIFAEAKSRVGEFAASTPQKVKLTPDIERIQRTDYPGTFVFLSRAKPEDRSSFSQFSVQLGLKKRGGLSQSEERANAVAELQAWKLAAAAESALSNDPTLALRLAQASRSLFPSSYADKVIIQAYNSLAVFYEYLFRGTAAADLSIDGSTALCIDFPYSTAPRLTSMDGVTPPITLQHDPDDKVTGGLLLHSNGAVTWTLTNKAQYWDRQGRRVASIADAIQKDVPVSPGLVPVPPAEDDVFQRSLRRDVQFDDNVRPCVGFDDTLVVNTSEFFSWDPATNTKYKRSVNSPYAGVWIRRSLCAAESDAVLEYSPDANSAWISTVRGALIHVLQTTGNVSEAALSSHARWAALSVGSKVHLYLDGTEVSALDLGQSEATDIGFSPDEKRVAVTALDGSCMLATLSVDSHQNWAGTVRRIVKEYRSLDRVVFAPTADRIAVARRDGIVNIYDLNGMLLFKMQGHRTGDGLNQSVEHIGWDRKATRVLTVARDLTARVWNMRNVRELAFDNLDSNGRAPEFLGFSSRGDRIVLERGGPNRKIILTDLKGRPVRELTGHQWFIRTVLFSADDRTVVSHSNDSIRIWHDGSTVPIVIAAKGSEYFGGNIQFSSDETQIILVDGVSGSRTPRAWTVSDGTPAEPPTIAQQKTDEGKASWRVNWAVTENGYGFWISDPQTEIRFFIRGRMSFSDTDTVAVSSRIGEHGYVSVKDLDRGGFEVFLINATEINRLLDDEELYGRIWRLDDETYRTFGIW